MRLDCIGLDAVEIVLAAVVKGRIDKKKIKNKKDQVLQFNTTVRYLCHGCDRKSNTVGRCTCGGIAMGKSVITVSFIIHVVFAVDGLSIIDFCLW